MMPDAWSEGNMLSRRVLPLTVKSVILWLFVMAVTAKPTAFMPVMTSADVRRAWPALGQFATQIGA